MALTIGDNFSYQGSKPLDARLTYNTIAEMASKDESTLYDGIMAFCKADEKTYQWKSTNEIDETLGKWREFESGESENLYRTNDDAYTEIADTDYFPAYNTAANKTKKTLWSNIKTVLKNFFNTLYQPKLTAGSNISIANNVIKAAANLNNHVYSTTEHAVGTWIDGKTVYEKTINFGALPNATSKSVAHNISNVSQFIDIGGFGKFTDGTYILFNYPGTAVVDSIVTKANSTQVTITTLRDRRDITAIITLRYTKTS